MKRLIVVALLVVGLLLASVSQSRSVRANDCDGCCGTAQIEFNVAFNRCRDNGCTTDESIEAGRYAQLEYMAANCSPCTCGVL